MTTETYTDFPFEVRGVKFVSRIYKHSDMYNTIMSMPKSVFTQLNQECVTDIIGDPSTLSDSELDLELALVNAGGSHAFILRDNN